MEGPTLGFLTLPANRVHSPNFVVHPFCEVHLQNAAVGLDRLWPLDATRARSSQLVVGKQKRVRPTRSGRGYPGWVWSKENSAGGCRFLAGGTL
jgi:hypothetical protein